YLCGEHVELRYTWVGWSTSAGQCSDSGGQNYDRACGDYPSSKCSKELGILEFLMPNFNYECGVTLVGATEVCFENLSLGGAEPLTYDWEFGDGSTSTE